MFCYLCKEKLTEQNQSIEHIIPNACGGRLKSKELLCKSCNSNFGKEYDAELARQMNDLCNLLLIKRERGSPQTLLGKTKSGEEYFLDFNGTPKLKKPKIQINTETPNQLVLNITANNQKELQKILKGLKRKYHNFNVENFINTSAHRTTYLDEPLTFHANWGGEKYLSQLLKSQLIFSSIKREIEKK